MLSGRETLTSIDDTLGELRRETDALDAHFQRVSAELAKVRQQQLALFGQLARIRMRELERGELLHALDDTDRRVNEILASRKGAQESLVAELASVEELLTALERERAEQHSAVEAAAELVDHAEAQAQQALAANEAYQAKLAAARESDTVADHAETKAEAAAADRVEKGRPYEADPVFSYLWQRGYGTARYRAWPLPRLLDRWVARSSNYEALRRNYSLLTEIPGRLKEHATRMRSIADRHLDDLRVLEEQAAAAAGVPEQRKALAAAEERLGQIDQEIEAQEAVLNSLVEKRGRFAAGEDEFAKQGSQLLSEALQRADPKILRRLAERTGSEEDDRLVEQLDDLDEERERLEQELIHFRRLHEAQRERMSSLEDVRRRFKRNHYDDLHSGFVNGALIATLFSQFLRGSVDVDDIWDAIEQQQRYRKRGANPRFGTDGFPRSPLPPIWRLPGRGRWKGGGGFRTGGGFGRGGFRTGGGF